MTDQKDNIAAAAQRMVEVIAPNADMYDDVMGSMGCQDAEAFADVFRAAGRSEAADMLIEGHSWHDDDPDDLHYKPGNEEAHKLLHY